MARYATVANLRDFLKGYTAADLAQYPIAALEGFLSHGEAMVDQFCDRAFHFHTANEVMNGNGSYTILLDRYPLFILDKIVVRYYPLTVVREFREVTGELLFDKELGKVSIRPSFALLGSFPADFANYYAYIFPRGESNINIVARFAFSQVGDNIGFDRLGNAGYQEVATVETVGADTFFRCGRPVGGVSESTVNAAMTTLAGLKMVKTPNGTAIDTFTDDSANWTVVDNRTMKIATASYDAGAMYRLIYIPDGVYTATVYSAAAAVLRSLGGRDDSKGSGGVVSQSIGAFSESFGDGGKYGPQMKTWETTAQMLLLPFRKLSLSMSR